MFLMAGPARLAGSILGVLSVLSAGSLALGQNPTGDTNGFITGAVAAAWQTWSAALQAVVERDSAKAEQLFGELLASNPAPFRLALLADYAVQRGGIGGAVLLFDQDTEAGSLGPNGAAVAALLATGREQMNQADDGWYFCQIGRFDVAEANFSALLSADPDPIALLEFTDQVPKRRDILLRLVQHPTLGTAARQIFRLLDRGEALIKADPTRIRENITRLAGAPRAFENGVAALKDSGEYAIPFIVQVLRDPAKKELLQPTLRCLPLIDRPALNPLVMALRIDDQTTRAYLVDALGKIGYAQAVPYLLQILQQERTPAEIKQAVTDALAALRSRGVACDAAQPASEAFYQLAEDYYANKPSLAADVRLDTANVWYWRDNMLQNVEVPTPIFAEVMALRCCEEALRLDPAHRPALALWLAANFRREARLPAGAQDPTRPENNPPSSYFAESAGAQICLMTLARAVDDGDPAVALGAIEALRKTAGSASLINDALGRLPLAEALSFPDRMVRVRAGLTLAFARPTKTFHSHQNLMPVLAETLTLHAGLRNALVVDPDSAAANSVAATLRDQGFQVVTDAGLLSGLRKVREQAAGVDVVVVASNIRDPGLTEALTQMRAEFRFAATPVAIVVKGADAPLVRELVRSDARLGQLPPDPSPTDLAREIAAVSKAVGARPITPEVGRALTVEALEALRLLAVSGNAIFNVADAEPALLGVLASDDAELRLAAAEVLGHLGSAKAQEAVAAIALNSAEPDELRIRMFAALSEAAKRHGALVGAEIVKQVVALAERDANLPIREAAAQTLGALSLPGEPASTIIRNQYRG